MATHLRWTTEQLDAHQARERARLQAVAGGNPMPGVDIDAAHRKQAKYRNERVTDEFGEKFDSKKELRRWRELLAAQRAGEVRWLAKQVRFHLPGQTTYIADFVWMDQLWKIHVEDCKSPSTRKLQAYRIKVRQMAEIHGVEVMEI